MKLGVLLPTFEESPDRALALAKECVENSVDGVFAYDHLWPMGSPTRPALAPLPVLAQVAREHPQLVVGTLVSRIGLYGEEHLVEQFETLSLIAPGRVICGLGVGDSKSALENEAYGLNSLSVDERVASLRSVSIALCDQMPVWLGAGKHVTKEFAEEIGSSLNYWQEFPSAELRSKEWTWAGSASEAVSEQLDNLEREGASWAVFTPTVNISQLKEWRRA
jgi:Luciferase-like monooxygenase